MHILRTSVAGILKVMHGAIHVTHPSVFHFANPDGPVVRTCRSRGGDAFLDFGE